MNHIDEDQAPTKFQQEPEYSFTQASFLQSGSKLSNCPKDLGIEIAFAGRSNAGKSSAINAITKNKKLARTSKTPGRTQLINFFTLGHQDIKLVDLPGYGYAKVPVAVKEFWGKHLDDYLRNRQALKCLVLIMDVRRPLTEFDQMILGWSDQAKINTLILLTKMDKLKYGQAKQAYLKVKQALKEHQALLDVVLFSSPKNTGVKESSAILHRLILAEYQAQLVAE